MNSNYDLSFRTIDGIRVASAPINGEADAFRATIKRWDENAWRLDVSTYGLPHEDAVRRTLAECKTLARNAYFVIESVNR